MQKKIYQSNSHFSGTSIYIAQDTSKDMKNKAFQEKELLQAALRFDQKALEQIYDLYSPGLYRYAVRFLGDPSVAEDCVADTFSRFLKVIRDRRGPQDFLRAYLHRIAHNWIVDYYRRAPNVTELMDGHPDSEALPEQEIELRIQQARTRKALLQLTPEQQRVIGLKYLQDWNTEDIAQALNKPVGAIKALQHRALVSLKKILEKEKTE